MKHKLITIIGLTGSTIATAFGGWDRFLQTLIIFMVIDWLIGAQLDALMGTAYVRDAVCIGFIANSSNRIEFP